MQLAVLGGHTEVVQELAHKFPLTLKFTTQVIIFGGRSTSISANVDYFTRSSYDMLRNYNDMNIN